MEKMYEIQRIKQVIREVEGGETFIIRSPEDEANVAAKFIGDEDREVKFLIFLTTSANLIFVLLLFATNFAIRIKSIVVLFFFMTYLLSNNKCFMSKNVFYSLKV
jgi:hypothetical protein